MAQGNLRNNIIYELLNQGVCCVNQLASVTNASRVGVSKELRRLCDKGIAYKAYKSRGYKLSNDIAFIIFKIYNSGAELLIYSLNKSVYERKQLDFLYSLSYEENVTFLSQNAQRYRNVLESRFSRVISCIIYDKPMDFSHIVSSKFSFKDSRAELTALRLCHLFNNDVILYINDSPAISFLCQSGIVIGKSSYPDGVPSAALKHTLSMFKPDRVVFEVTEADSLSKECFKNNVCFSLIEKEHILFSDEQALLAKVLSELSN